MNRHLKDLIRSAALWSLLPAVYLGFWHWSLQAGAPWPAWLNIPGLLLLALAWPWSTGALELVFFHGRTVGAAGSLLIHVAVILGFGVNLSLLSALARQVFKRVTSRAPQTSPEPGP